MGFSWLLQVRMYSCLNPAAITGVVTHLSLPGEVAGLREVPSRWSENQTAEDPLVICGTAESTILCGMTLLGWWSDVGPN